MNLGADPKKTGILVGLLALAGIVYWMNSSSDAPSTSTRPRPKAADPTADVMTPVSAPKVAAKRSVSGSVLIGNDIFKLRPVPDPGKVDPTLRIDLLAKVQAVDMEGGKRNIFKVEQPPPPPAVVTASSQPKPPDVGVIHPNGKPPDAAAATPATPPPPPPAPPINLKYYGYSTKRIDGEKKAFFLDGEDVIIAAEGEIIKKQYKVVRIGVNSVQMEDTASKRTQTLPLQTEAAPV